MTGPTRDFDLMDRPGDENTLITDCWLESLATWATGPHPLSTVTIETAAPSTAQTAGRPPVVAGLLRQIAARVFRCRV